MVLQVLLMLQRLCHAIAGCSLCSSLWASITSRCKSAKSQCDDKEVAVLTQKEPPQPPRLQEKWDEAGVAAVDVVVRAMSGDVVYSQEGVTANMPVAKLLGRICQQTGNKCEVLQLCAGATVLDQSLRIGDGVAPALAGEPVELILLRLPGPAVEVEATSGRRIELLDAVPDTGSRCHADRNYRFISLGDFAQRPTMRYVLTSNEDKNTPPDEVMWKLTVRAPVTVYLNFRSEQHVTHTGAAAWLTEGGWARSKMSSTVSSGVPNGPYQGPVYSKSLDSGTVDLMGSNCGEGTYFVFVDVQAWG